MKYMTDDDNIFMNEQDAVAHQEKLDEIKGFDGKIENFLDEQDPQRSDRSRQMYRRVIKEWLIWGLDKE